jgi:hypothetical protein
MGLFASRKSGRGGSRDYIEPPIRFGARINCWCKPYILRLQQQSIPQPLITAATKG